MLNWPLLSHDNADQSGADYVSPWDCCVSAVDSYVGLPGSMGYSTWDAVNILLGWTAISFDDDKDKNPGKKNNLSFNRGSTREQKRFLPGSFFFFFFVEGGWGGAGGGGWLWTLANIEISWPWPHSWLIWQIYYLAESANPAFWLAARAGKMGLSCPLGISRSGPARKIFPFSPYNKLSVDQVCSVKMAGYWPRSVLRFYWPQRRKRTWPVYRHLDLTLGK